MKRTPSHPKKRRALRFFLGALFSMIAGGLGAGLLRTRNALSGIDVSTLLFYYDSLLSEFTDHRVTSLAEVFSSYSVITDVASASIRLAAAAGALFLLAYVVLSVSRAKVTLSVAVRRGRFCWLPLAPLPVRSTCPGISTSSPTRARSTRTFMWTRTRRGSVFRPRNKI